MTFTCMKWSTVVASTATVMSLTWGSFASAQAAEFKIKIGNRGNGSLIFQESPLTNTGTETLTLSQLTNFTYSIDYSSNDAPGVGYYVFSNDEFYSPSTQLVFEDGELVGIYDSVEYFPYYETFYGGSQSYTIDGVYSFELKGDLFREAFTGVQSSGGFDYETEEFYSYENDYDNATFALLPITFEKVVPLEPIPEPVTLLGTGTAIALGTMFKKMKGKN